MSQPALPLSTSLLRPDMYRGTPQGGNADTSAPPDEFDGMREGEGPGAPSLGAYKIESLWFLSCLSRSVHLRDRRDGPGQSGAMRYTDGGRLTMEAQSRREQVRL